LILIIAAIFVTTKLSWAEVKIWPKTEVSDFTTKVTIDKKIESSDFSQKIIPGKVFELEKIISKDFSSSGKKAKEGKAEGVIRVYNEYSTQEQVLIATTRFVSKEGKLFRSVEAVTVAGGHYEGGKLIPGESDVRVKADEAGQEYNIDPSTFSIPGLAGTPKYTKIYGKSFQKMTGGFKKEVPQLTENDLQKAKDFLTQKVKEEGENSLKENIPPEFIFIKEVLKTEILDASSSAKVGEEVEKFNYRVKIKATTITFLKKDLENLAKNYIISLIPKEKRIRSEDLKIDYSLENFDFGSGKIILSINLEAKIYSMLEEAPLKEALSGKSQSEAKIFLENQPEIERAEVKIFPPWLKKSPADREKIKIKIIID
jgi:hypothetical protein